MNAKTDARFASGETTSTLERVAGDLARAHDRLERAKSRAPLFADLASMPARLSAIHVIWGAARPEEPAHQKASEWFLDNEYVFRRALRQVNEEFPTGFQRRLPLLAEGESKGAPRLLVLTRRFLETTALDFDVASMHAFFDAYQAIAPLTIGELWALPAVLRAAALRALDGFLAELVPAAAALSSRPREHDVGVEPAKGVENVVKALRLLSEIDWKAFFERSSRVDAVLRKDPAGIYPAMDFASCDAYRRVVEEIAWRTKHDELSIARAAVELASEQDPTTRGGHVGEYLVGRERGALERRVGCAPRLADRLLAIAKRSPALTYVGAILTLTAGVLVLLGSSALTGRPAWVKALALVVAAIPASSLATALVQRVVAKVVRPRALPKLDFSSGIPDDCRTVIAVPALLGTEAEVRSLVRQLEVHYLANPDPKLAFALLTDDADAESADADRAAATKSLVDLTSHWIEELNARHGTDGVGPFHLLHREPRWNPSEQRFMGWERKRGKLEELNRLLRGDKTTSYVKHVGDPRGLERVRFVITLDADTELPMGGAARMVGLLAHPLNRAVFDARGAVTAGYTVAQPRIETSPTSGRRSRFARLFAGDAAFDIYTHAVSDVYQDLFGAGIYVGKGIYEIDTFMQSVEGRVPDNALASHDLFEGVHGRAALASDIVLYEDYPPSYLAYARRKHRWIRGDWQLSQWLLPRVPLKDAQRGENRLSALDRWKIFDNLRRSLLSTAVLVLFVAGALGAWGHPLSWILGGLVALFLPSLVLGGGSLETRLERSGLTLVFLPHDAALSLDAIVRALVRMTITQKHLLQWTTAAATARAVGGSGSRGLVWKEMAVSPVLGLGVFVTAALGTPAASLPLVAVAAAWIAAPEIARWLSGVRARRHESIDEDDVRALRLLARRTWLFFETFVGPNDQWLPPDNVQEEPRTEVAHRTSPTNIGMFLLSALTAYDFGFTSASELSVLVKSTLDTLGRVERYRGHILNWYDTRTLEPLLPRYVSTVDSGNLGGCLLALKQGCLEIAQAPVVRKESWRSFGDVLALFDGALERIRLPREGAGQAVRSLALRIRKSVEAAPGDFGNVSERIVQLCEEDLPALDRELLEWIELGTYRHDTEALHELRAWLDAVHRHARDLGRQIDNLHPWLRLAHASGAPSEEEWRALDLHPTLALSQIPAACEAAKALLPSLATPSADRASWIERMLAALTSGAEAARRLHDELQALAALADAEFRRMDFSLLYDRERKLFHIGYDVTADRLDAHHYDLLASEARLASYLAIVKKDAPETHWYALGRPLTEMAGAPALLSWGGTMFEYLMPSLLMRSHEETLLAESEERAALAQIAYGAKKQVPWGISESAYAHFDAHGTYQYRSFGAPGLGLKRGLEEDLVVAPYASALALAPSRARAVTRNFRELERLGAMGLYGLYDAVDFQRAPETSVPRAREGTKREHAVVRAHMAHHQGMILAALDNFLCDRAHVRRFHSDPIVKSGELLLDERVPPSPALESPTVAVEPKIAAPTGEVALKSWPATREAGPPPTWVLGNGRLTTILTESGAGGLRWRELEITRGLLDESRDVDGTWIYVRDEETGRLGSATRAPTQTASGTRTVFHGHKIEFLVRQEGLSIRTEVAVAPADDVEIRLVTIHNETDRTRHVTVTSSAEPVLEAALTAARHPAFSKLFLESESISEVSGVLFTRRLRSPSDPEAVVVHRLVADEGDVAWVGSESDRAAFVGRHGSARAPQALVHEKELSSSGPTGCVLDPIMAVMARVELAPRAQATLAFVTAVARSRDATLDLARRYGSLHVVRWAVRDAEPEAARRVQKAGLDPALLSVAQRILTGLLHPDRRMRAPTNVLSNARPCRSRLWGHGISGDDPILLLRTGPGADARVVRDVLGVQRYLRSCGVRFDVVLLDETASGYLGEGGDAIRRMVSELGLLDWIHRRGGIYIVASDQLDPEARERLEGTARVWLDAKAGTLEEQLAARPARPPLLPHFEGTLAVEGPVRGALPPCSPLLFDNGVGGFSEDGREYVVRLADGRVPPMPWCNVLANPVFGCLVSESSLGATWSLNSGENRLTPWRNDPLTDVPSEVLYLRDEETAAVWSPTPLPAGTGAETRVRHGAGYTVYETESHGLYQELTIFVPPDAPVKIARLRLENRRQGRRRLTATYYTEWVLGTRREDGAAYVRTSHDGAHGCLFAETSWEAEFAGRVAFLAADRAPHGFTCDRSEFLGRGDYAFPDALRRWGLAGATDLGIDPCAALQVHLDLAPGASLTTYFVLGEAETREEAFGLIERFRDPSAVAASRTAVDAHWDELLGAVRVRTPEPALDLMLNRWLLYQTLSSRFFGRTGFYQSSGAFGFRDQLQDVMALVHAAPDRVRAHVLESASHQFEQGDVLHWWHPPSGRGVRTHCSDDMLWLPFVTCHYVLATGDVGILSERVSYLTADQLRREEHDRYGTFQKGGDGTLVEHCRRALERGFTAGPHGLPLMKDGDWNDGMNRVGAKGLGESVWLGWFAYATARKFADVCERLGEAQEAASWRARAETLRQHLDESAWDGDWYLRAFYDDGTPLGSASARVCRIDAIAQSWSVISGAGDEARARRAVRAADDLLAREAERLVLLLWPAFDGSTKDPGYIRAYPPGVRENGGQYTHAATWLGWAHAMLGDGDRAERILRLLNPILHASTPETRDHYKVEPYVLAGDVYGNAPYVGRGGWSWYTGAAAWMWRLGVEAVLGLSRSSGDLAIDPCIPREWRGFEAWVRAGSETIHVVVENPDGVSRGVTSITVDGALRASNRLELPSTVAADGGVHEVRVRLGAERAERASTPRAKAPLEKAG